MLMITVIGMFTLMIIGVPIAFSIGLAGIIAFVTAGNEPLFSVLKRMVIQLDSFPLLALPYFIFAGELMSQGGISRRMVNLSNSLVGFMRGGMGMVDVMASMLFAGISGSATADTSAIGSLLIPQLIEKKYPRGFAAALEAVSGSLGVIIPPSTIMILYGALSNQSIGKLFLGGIVPGVLFGIGQMLIVYIYATIWGWKGSGRPRIKEIIKSFKEAVWALIMPLIILGGIIFGIFTATEAGVVAVVYGLFVGLFIHKELDIKIIKKAFIVSAEITGFALFMICSAAILGHIFILEQVPVHLVNFLLRITNDPQILLVILLGIIIVAGFFIEMFPMMVIIVPVLIPVANQFGFDPIHFGVLVCIAITLGGCTPPVGGLLFITGGIAKASMSEIMRYIYPFIAIMLLFLAAAVFFPGLITYIPNKIM
jgi:C4-dicarboxylate transporter DctM subunit